MSLRRALGGGNLPFLVPSVFEAIRESEFGSLTSIVPGEADQWCAAYAYTHPLSMIFTGDTDLLAYEPGPGSVVVMFQDMLEDSKSLKVYDPEQIAIGLDLGRNLQPLAYAIYFHPKANTMGHHISYAKQLLLGNVALERYAAWKEGYTYSTVVDDIESCHAISRGLVADEVLQGLDSRISELITQVLRLSPLSENGQSTVDFYLPFLVEFPESSSGWNRAANIRKLGYALLFPHSAASVTVREFVRKSYDISSNKMVPYTQPQALEEANSLHKNLEKWMRKRKSLKPVQKWRLFAAITALGHMTDNQARSITFDKIWRAVEGESHWDPIYTHFKASTDAVLYSLRILSHCISIFENSEQEQDIDVKLCNTIADLSEILEQLPRIEELFPTTRPQVSIPPEGPLSKVILRLLPPKDEPQGDFETPKGKKKRKPSKDPGKPVTAPVKSSNPFAMLELAED